MWLHLKDKFNISNEAWHEIAMTANGVPDTYSIKKQINELNSKWNLKPSPGDAEGVQLGFAETLQEHIEEGFPCLVIMLVRVISFNTSSTP